MKKIIATFILSLVFTQSTFADTRMVIETPDGEMTIWSNDNYFRAKLPQTKESANSPLPPGDMLGVLKLKKIYMIIDKDKILIDMSAPMPFAGMSNLQKPPKLKISFKNKGAGKKIAGLTTTQYEVSAQGQKCFTMLLTKDKIFSALMKKYDSIDSNHGDSQNLCEEVENQMDDAVSEKYGYAVKTIDKNGNVTMLLKEFETNVSAPKKYLALPKGYQVMTMMDMMTKAMKDGTAKMY